MRKPSYKQIKIRQRQQGVVVIIALIILIAMSLAGIAANRALEAAVGVAGNLAFKQSSVYGADRATDLAVTWLAANGNILANDNTAEGYLSSASMAEPDWTLEDSWVIKKDAGVDGVGNALEYVIHRLCSQANTAYNDDINQCMTMETGGAGGDGNSVSAGSFQFKSPPHVTYRVTARARSPRGGYTVVQTFLTIPQ